MDKTPANTSLIDTVFSWSLQDVLNENLYKSQVKKIPAKFNSTTAYLESFKLPLIEETHADLLSSLTTESMALSLEILSVTHSEGHSPKNLTYDLIGTKVSKKNKGTYQPAPGDLIVLTGIRPKCTAALNMSEDSYLIASVTWVDYENPHIFSILSSKPLMDEEDMKRLENIKVTLFVVFLTNTITNVRIWKALNRDSDPKGKTMNLIKNVLLKSPTDEENCTRCLYGRICGTSPSYPRSIVESFGLNNSQEAAVLTSIGDYSCHHRNTVKLVWGPPGTGKTKTIGVLLFALLRMKCRTVICAPTNTAVLQVASRLMSFVTKSTEFETYGLGDIVLFGNKERMQIDGSDDLLDIFVDSRIGNLSDRVDKLSKRVDMLSKCFSPVDGWKGSLRSMIELLEDPVGQYRQYLQRSKKSNDKEDGDEGDDDNNKRKDWKKLISQILNKVKTMVKQQDVSNEEKDAQEAETCEDDPLTYIEFVRKTFNSISQRLRFCLVNLYTHLPTRCMSLEVGKNMMQAVDLLRSLEILLHDLGDEAQQKDHNIFECENSDGSLRKLSLTKKDCLQILRSLTLWEIPDFGGDIEKIRDFCLANACLLFCTASGSTKLHGAGEFDLLVIDEAAQLKECESTIPLQLPGLRHAILIGDELQLPAMVHSKIAEKAEFGRSLFERLVLLGQKKHLLNIQYRMHPSISLFPNREFYNNKIVDAPAVKDRSYVKHFLGGNMYGPYSLINVTYGKEQFDNGHSPKNMVEVAVVCEIVANLFKEFTLKKQKLSVGVISPYNAQVHEIEKKLGKKYARSVDSGFSISVRSVDGFQGGEEDVIIISTVRSNGNGSVGFLSNRRRANVALTRARHCCWIVGNEATLFNSGSIWKKLVTDAKERKCFYNADEDKSLTKAMTTALIELEQFEILLNMNFPMFEDATWRVCFSDGFWSSVAGIKNTQTTNQLLTLLEKLSSGWRLMPNKKTHYVLDSSSAFLELYPVNDLLNLLWTVDIIKENSHYKQVLKIWDILPLQDVPKVAEHLDSLFVNYTVDKINRCKYRSLERGLVVPMKWPVNHSGVVRSIGYEADSAQLLSETFAALEIVDGSMPTATTSNQRLEYSREELLALQHSPLSLNSPVDTGKVEASSELDKLLVGRQDTNLHI
ncbi:hypothetical protein SLEP1_g12984 [Rubroshorea leprosula]|uniref:Helicase MAGATAMA 3 n=1 Tax=Rubroshorea leprosula TaxID=152421 RepID=A0AAV5IIT5_9ROSI|nr:hypothetical protein SLEP1_g12984 [Rubroshorea leprosula]